MITRIDFSAAPMQYGSRRILTAESTTPFLGVEIKCFVDNPPPAGYRACPECGSFQVASGSPTIVSAPQGPFTWGRNQLEITVTDGAGDQRNIMVDLID